MDNSDYVLMPIEERIERIKHRFGLYRKLDPYVLSIKLVDYMQDIGTLLASIDQLEVDKNTKTGD